MAVFSIPSFMAIASAVLKPMPRMSRAKRYGVIRHDLDGIGAIGLEDPHCPSGADAVAVQEDHDFAHSLLFGPGGENAGRTNRPDAIDLAQSIRTGLDDVEYVLTECAHELLGVDWPHATDHAGGQVSLDPFGRRWRRGAEEPRFELLAVGAVVDPLARGHDPFAGGNGSRMAHHRHDITMSARPRAQHAETVLSVVVGYPLDETCQHFPGVRLRIHADHHIPRFVLGFRFILRTRAVAVLRIVTRS